MYQLPVARGEMEDLSRRAVEVVRNIVPYVTTVRGTKPYQ